MVQENCVKKKVIIICGATASGKTDLAVEVAKAINSEVISADSMYIYKGLNIGTAKPSVDEMQGVKHHIIDVVEPTENFTVSDYKNMAEPIINALHEQGKIPVICGGVCKLSNTIDTLALPLFNPHSFVTFVLNEPYFSPLKAPTSVIILVPNTCQTFVFACEKFIPIGVKFKPSIVGVN
jgi:hypothetical protein